jgi:hypothetical protein
MQYIYTMKYYLAIKMMDSCHLEQGGGTQMHEYKYHIFSYMEFKKLSLIKVESRKVVTRGQGRRMVGERRAIDQRV